ncbi:acyl-CoA dehydrogenase family protein [Ancylobacter defluvii]|uniref:Pigment protein n=1 Tax=Ancylobacter defluvii TaxID=1282440 RepID=A0A9W6JZ61_9HYPH|nr:acyl-CoA dehydrogenase family protein [Ancylobacter defluvii]MBS7589158.1 acyl-CoA dehydrogenase [Ancylobacter defluvii]GLK84770.1 pigment protein [Ancylobacter defluvii]
MMDTIAAPRSIRSPADQRHDDLLQRATDLASTFAGRAARAEDLRRLPRENERDLHDSGLYRMLQPRALGGSELGYESLITIGAALAAGCASTAWNLTNLASHHWMLAMFPPAAQDRVWNEDPDALIASSFVFPAAKVAKAPGGYVVSGRWPFSSGVDVCTWNMLAGVVRTEGEAPDHRVFLLPRSDYTILDTWHVTGLKGTGSNDVVCEEVFVPEEMTVSVAHLKGGATPGSERHPAPLYRVPVFALFPAILSGVGLGNGEGALTDYVASTRKRSASYTGARLAELQSIQIHIGSAATRLSHSRRMMLAICEEAMADAARGHVPDLVTKFAYRRDLAFATDLATAAVDEINAGSGAQALYLAGSQQRRFRDAHAISAHIAFSTDVANAAFGRLALGMEADNPVV